MNARLFAVARRARSVAGRLRRTILKAVAGSHSTVRGRCVALTYDDGPDPEVTPRLLDLLSAFGVHATFFVIGEKAERCPDIVRRMIQEGHSVGAHSMHHPDFGRISLSAARRDTEQVFSALAHTIGHPVRLYRPPHGHLTLRTALMLRRLKAETWLWGIDSGDWREESTVDSILDRSLHALDGGVVLMHDTTDKTVEATRLLLERLSSSRVQTLALWAGTSG